MFNYGWAMTSPVQIARGEEDWEEVKMLLDVLQGASLIVEHSKQRGRGKPQLQHQTSAQSDPKTLCMQG